MYCKDFLIGRGVDSWWLCQWVAIDARIVPNRLAKYSRRSLKRGVVSENHSKPPIGRIGQGKNVGHKAGDRFNMNAYVTVKEKMTATRF